MVARSVIRPSRRATGGVSACAGTWSRMASISSQGVIGASASRDFVGDQDFRGRRRTWFRPGADRPRQKDRASPFTQFAADWKATASRNGRRSHIESSPEVLLSGSQELLNSERLDEAFDCAEARG